MKRVAIIGIAAATAVFGAINSSSAETTMPMQDLALVSESAGADITRVDSVEPDAVRRFQFGRFQFGRFQFGRFQFGRFHAPRFQFGRFQFGRFQFPHRGF